MLLFPKNQVTLYSCEHCGQSVDQSRINAQLQYQFCCQGCEIVWDILKNNSFEKYQKENSVNPKFEWLDKSEYNQEYVQTDQQKGISTVFLYVEGLDCHSCFWTLEKLPELLVGVLLSKVDIQTSVLKIQFAEQRTLSSIVSFVESLGYTTHPLKDFSSINQLRIKEKRQDLVRLGIAGACAGNAMIYSIANYAGADGVYLTIFHFYSVLFSLPALTYASMPFYKKAWGSLKKGLFNIDLSISLALIIGGSYGIYSSLILNKISYIDSLSMLVFLLLLTRFSLKTAIKKGAITNSFAQFLHSYNTKKIEKGQTVELPAHKLAPNDHIQIDRNQVIAADGTIEQGETYINESALTGESHPCFKKANDLVYAGTFNEGAPILVKVTNNFSSSKMGQILKSVESNIQEETEFAKLSDQIAKKLLFIVLGLGLLSVIYHLYFSNSLILGIETFITLLIVTCPCALGLNSPMVYQKALSFLSTLGIMVKSPAVLERALNLRHLFFDKTGTLTEGGLVVESFDFNLKDHNFLIKNLYSIEKCSTHPIAKSLTEFIEKNYPEVICDFRPQSDALLKSIPSIGLQAILADKTWLIKGISNNSHYTHQVVINGNICAHFKIAEQVKPAVKNILETLAARKLNLHLLSGDNIENVLKVTTNSQLNFKSTVGNASPEQKKKILDDHPYSAMIGDGANDSLALSSQDVIGISVCKSMPLAISASDVWLQRQGLFGINQLLVTSHQVKKLLTRNIQMSLAYNVLFISLTLLGYISPLLAAFLMPVSALTITISIYSFPLKKLEEETL